MVETREQAVAKLLPEDERLQYDMDDPERIYKTSEEVTKSFVNLLQAVADFRNTSQEEADEDSASRMKEARTNLVEAYAKTAVDLHKLGSVFRISGEAFDRMVSYLSGPEEAALILSDL